MATRRNLLRWAGVLPAAGLLGACARPPAARPPSPPAPGDLLVVDTEAGLGVVDVRDARLAVAPAARTATWDGRVLAGAVVGADGATATRVTVLGVDGRERFAATVDGELTPRVVSAGGHLVALTPATEEEAASPYRPAGRESTTIVVAGTTGETHRFTLPGCLEPEAFSAGGDALFVLDYQPPAAPERYRVRVLYLASGALTPLLTRAKQPVPEGAEEQMRGQGRQAVYSPGQQYLYTLYTHQPDHEHTRDLIAGARDDAPHVHAFVHTLSLDQFFAYCIDLPAPFGEGPPEGHAIALRRLGGRPIVVDTGTGAIARLDHTTLTVAATGSFPTATGPTYAAVAPSDELCFIGTGTTVHVYRTTTLTPAMTWSVDAPVRGLAVGPPGTRLWVGQPDAAVALDASTGRELGRVTVPGLTTVREIV